MSPVLFFKTVLGRINDEYVKRKTAAQIRLNESHVLTLYASTLYAKQMSEMGQYNVLPQQNNNNYKVTRISSYGMSSNGIYDDHQHIVLTQDLNTITCTCGRPQGIPCRHVLAVANSLQLTETILNTKTVTKWFPPFFTMEAMWKSYNGNQFSMETASHITPSCHDLLPPLNKGKLDKRSSFKRKKSKQQFHTKDKSGNKVLKCSNCNSYDHTLHKCNIPIMDEFDRIKFIKDKKIEQDQMSKMLFITTNYVSTNLSTNSSTSDVAIIKRLEDVDKVLFTQYIYLI
jgi:hypothetical protein